MYIPKQFYPTTRNPQPIERKHSQNFLTKWSDKENLWTNIRNIKLQMLKGQKMFLNAPMTDMANYFYTTVATPGLLQA